MKTFRKFTGIFLVFIICFTVCACQKKIDNEAGTPESISSQTAEHTHGESSSATETSTTVLSKKPTEKNSSKSKSYKKATAATEKQTSAGAFTYPASIDGYVTKAAADVTEPKKEPQIKYVLTDISSNLSSGIKLYGTKATNLHEGTALYLHFGCSGDNKYFYNNEYTMQKQVDGRWVEMEQLREYSAGKTYELNGKIRYSHVENLYLDKYFNNPENGRYKIKLNICTDEGMKIPADFEVEFTITEHTVERASINKKIENPVDAGFSLNTSGMDYYYTHFSKEDISKAAELYNKMELTPIEKAEKHPANYYTLSIIDSKGYEYYIIIHDSGNYIYMNGNYYYAENGNELYNYTEEIYMSYHY